MDSSPTPSRRALLAYAGPFVLFCLLNVLPGLFRAEHPTPATPWWLAVPEFWVYPLQTVLCGAMLLFYRREYPRASTATGLIFGAVIGLVALVLWISPQAFFHFAPRVEGFDPGRLLDAGKPDGGRLAYQVEVAFRFLRLVVVVPWLEEVFWRGLVLRDPLNEDFFALPFGAFTRLSFWMATVGFMLEHSPVDYAAAFVTGLLYNWVAIRTKSLPVCILAHALTNLLLGLYVMHTHQWGFW